MAKATSLARPMGGNELCDILCVCAVCALDLASVPLITPPPPTTTAGTCGHAGRNVWPYYYATRVAEGSFTHPLVRMSPPDYSV